jgi:hypothetical protein
VGAVATLPDCFLRQPSSHDEMASRSPINPTDRGGRIKYEDPSSGLAVTDTS